MRKKKKQMKNVMKEGKKERWYEKKKITYKKMERNAQKEDRK